MLFENCYTPSPNFPYRYILPERLHNFLQENLSDYIIEIGRSTLDKPIYMARFGNGNTKILAWSQMHGNEANATLAMLDILETWEKYPEFKTQLLDKIQLDFIFMLNPDGSQEWKRRNALDIDLNRDFIKQSSKEFTILNNIVEATQYDYALNLHEQRTIFSTDGINPATLSFLAPSENVEREITGTRKKCMAVIQALYHKMNTLIPSHIARYTDEFYSTSTGDNFTKMGIPTILFEGGHYENDYQRVETRKNYAISLYYALKIISENPDSTKDWEKYLDIPENKETHYDIIYRNVKLNTDFPCVVDIAIQYREDKLADKEDITFTPIVVEIGDCGNKKGWKEIDCTNKIYKSKSISPKLNCPQDFEII